MTTQPEALALADTLDQSVLKALCAEIRRLHEVNTELLAALKDLIGCAEPHRDRIEIKAARAAIAKGEAK